MFRSLQIVSLVLTLIGAISAVPHWDGFLSRNSMDDLSFSGALPLEAKFSLGPNPHRKFLSSVDPGNPGNMTVAQPATTIAPAFFIKQGQLYHFVNDSAIYSVNLLNTTGIADRPLQLVMGAKHDGFRGGFWRWQASMLYYDYGRWGNQGIFYQCPSNEEGGIGVYTHIHPAHRPLGCDHVTFHSFVRDSQGRRTKQVNQNENSRFSIFSGKK